MRGRRKRVWDGGMGDEGEGERSSESREALVSLWEAGADVGAGRVALGTGTRGAVGACGRRRRYSGSAGTGGAGEARSTVCMRVDAEAERSEYIDSESHESAEAGAGVGGGCSNSTFGYRGFVGCF